MNEFDQYQPKPRPGMSSIAVFKMLSDIWPDKQWKCVATDNSKYGNSVAKFGSAFGNTGKLGKWKFKRVTITEYPTIMYEYGPESMSKGGWVGTIEVKYGKKKFLIFSWLLTNGGIGSMYYVDTTDMKLIKQFLDMVYDHYNQFKGQIHIRVMGGQDMYIPEKCKTKLFLPEKQLTEIKSQVDVFFKSKELYDKLGIDYRRGLLFVGPPGNGKTLTAKMLARHCYKKHGARIFCLSTRRNMDEEWLDTLLTDAAAHAPGLVIMEDLDSMVNETKITRAGMLAVLDGISTKEGILILASTNNPTKVDPALAKRPSRFDRIWKFGLPDRVMRMKYLGNALPGLGDEPMTKVLDGTEDWSYAYLNELRVSAMVMAISDGRSKIVVDDVLHSQELLSEQFKAGEKDYAHSKSRSLGFGGSPECPDCTESDDGGY